MEDDKKLNKFIEGELVQLSPLEKRSIELKAEAEAVEISDKSDLIDAKKVKKALVSHRTSVKDMRLTFTRKLDNMKDQFIKKQDQVLEASIAGEAIVKDKIDVYEKEQRLLKEAEENRIQSIIDKFVMPQLDRKIATKEEVARARAAIKMELGLLDIKDRNKVIIKKQVAAIRESLDELEQFITDRDEQARIAEEQRIEQERLDADRKKLKEAEDRIISGMEKRILEESKIPSSDAPGRIRSIVDDTEVEGLAMLDNIKSVDPIIIPDHDHDQVHCVEQPRWELNTFGYIISDNERVFIAQNILNGSDGGEL